jgi:transcriptional regulator with XRE-family HTH domain
MSNDVGSIIKKARLEKGLSQQKLADYVGVGKSAVAKWENGRISEIKRTNLKKLSEALGLKPTQLFGDIESNPIGTADFMAEVYLDGELRKMIAEYIGLSVEKKAQVREYVHLLSAR